MAIVNLASIFAKIRRLTGAASPEQLPNYADSSDPNSVGLADYVNSFYLYDFPTQFRSLKLKDKYTFNTTMGVDTYAFDSEKYTTVEMPCYCAKREIQLFQDPWSFYGVNFNWQYQNNFITGDGTNGLQIGIITAATQAANCQITSVAHGLSTGDVVKIVGIVGMVQLNGGIFTITVNGANTFLLNIDSTGFAAYVSGGQWQFSVYNGFTSARPLIRSVNNIPYFQENITNIVVDSPAIGSTTIYFANNDFRPGQNVYFQDVNTTGTIAAVLNGFSYPVISATSNSIVLTLNSNTLTYTGGGTGSSTQGSLNYPASRVQNILITVNVANGNTLNVTDDGFGNLIGDCTAGNINYDTGAITGLVFTQDVPAGNPIQIQYNPTPLSIPLSILFFQNQFCLRPVPDRGYTIEMVAYRQPTQALLQTPANQETPELSE